MPPPPNLNGQSSDPPKKKRKKKQRKKNSNLWYLSKQPKSTPDPGPGPGPGQGQGHPRPSQSRPSLRIPPTVPRVFEPQTRLLGMSELPPNEPGVSIRQFIRWVPGVASEPTSTLVLTSSTRRFVDIRVLLPKHPDEPYLPNEGGPMHRLDWAFAGSSTNTLIPGPSILHPSNPDPSPPSTTPNPVAHTTFSHWVDSRTSTPGPDEGDMYPQPDSALTLELGIMPNPATGVTQPYEEMWEDVAAEPVEGKRRCVVLDLDSAAHDARGRVVRVGTWCQGILKVGGRTTVERWEWQSGAQGDEKDSAAGWKRVCRLGGLWLPCSVTFLDRGANVGDKVEYGEFVWEVKEVVTW